MTIVMAIREGDVVVLASDSASTDENFEHCTRSGCSKAWVQHIDGFGNVLVGFSGNFSAGLWIRHGFQWPRKTSINLTFEAYLVRYVQPSLMKSLHERYKTETDENRTSWDLLISLPHHIFKLHSDGDVESCASMFAAIGDAAPTALGALHVLAGSRPSWECLDLAFDACYAFRASVRGPLHMLALGKHGIMHCET